MCDIVEFCAKIGAPEGAIAFLRDRGLLHGVAPICREQQCGRTMSEVKNVSCKQDGLVWRCPTHKGSKQSVRVGSCLENSKLSLTQFILSAYFWALSIPPTTQVVLSAVSLDTLLNWNQFFQDVCSEWLLQEPICLGGPGKIVQIDENLISKQNFLNSSYEEWVVGFYDAEQKVGLVKLMEKRDRDFLLLLIRRYVAPGTEIHSKTLAKYSEDIDGMAYKHVEVDQIHNFVECFMRNAKHKSRQVCGTTQEMLPSFLDELMWRQVYGKESVDAFDNLLRQMSVLNPC